MNIANDERERLIAGHLDGSLDSTDSAILFQWLETDADARSLLLAAAQQASALPRLSLGDIGESQQSAPAMVTRKKSKIRLGKPLIAIAATLLVTIALALWFHAQTPTPVTIVRGKVAAIERDGTIHAPDTALREGDRIRSGEEDLVLRWTTEASELTLAPHSSLQLIAVSGHKRIALESGALAADIAHQSADGGLDVVTDSGSIAVVGTQFQVSVETSGTQVTVTDGRVRVQPRDGSTPTLLAAGFTTVVTSSAVHASRPISSVASSHTSTPSAISITAADFAAVAGKGWEGSLVDDGIRSVPVTDATVDRVTMPVRRPTAYAVLNASMTCTFDLTAEQACTLAVVAVCDAPDGSWMANIQSEQRIVAGRQRVTFAFADFVRSAGSGSPVSSHGRIASLAIMSWSPNKPFVIHRCDIGTP